MPLQPKAITHRSESQRHGYKKRKAAASPLR